MGLASFGPRSKPAKGFERACVSGEVKLAQTNVSIGTGEVQNSELLGLFVGLLHHFSDPNSSRFWLRVVLVPAFCGASLGQTASTPAINVASGPPIWGKGKNYIPKHPN